MTRIETIQANAKKARCFTVLSEDIATDVIVSYKSSSTSKKQSKNAILCFCYCCFVNCPGKQNADTYSNPYDITYGPDENCTLSTCDVRTSLYEYQPSLPANAIFVALFGITLVVHVLQGLRWKTWAFMIAMVLGCIAEMVGYGGRLLMHENPFSFPGFITQIVCITIAPAFFSAAIYITLSQIVRYLGVKHSRFKPSLYYWFFICCDVISLTLQATGGGMSSSSTGSSQAGVNIAIAGLSFQVFTLSIFTALAVDYWIQYLRNRGHVQPLVVSFKIFVASLSLATVLILIRCIYRIDELSNGYSGPLIHDEGLFIGLEGVVVIVAALLLNVGHPGPVLKSTQSFDFERENAVVVSDIK